MASGPCFCLMALELLGDVAERLVPGGGDELAVLLDERRGEPVGAVDEAVAEPSLDAEPAFVDRVRPRGDAHHFVPAHVQGEVAAAAAVGADGLDLLHVLLPALAERLLADERAGGADADALAAELAVQVLFKGRRYFGGEAPAGDIDRTDALDLVADAHALAAEDALLHVPFDKGVHVLFRVLAPFAVEPVRPDLVEVGQFLERAVAGPLADHAVVRMVGQEEFDDGAALALDLLVRGLDFHALGHRRGAGGHRPGHALYLDEAEPASAVGFEPRVVAERRDVDIVPPRRIEDGHIVGHGYFPAVYGKIYHSLPFFDRLELARLEAGAALDADVLDDLVRLLLLADDGARRADPRAGRAALAELLEDAVRTGGPCRRRRDSAFRRYAPRTRRGNT